MTATWTELGLASALLVLIGLAGYAVIQAMIASKDDTPNG